MKLLDVAFCFGTNMLKSISRSSVSFFVMVASKGGMAL